METYSFLDCIISLAFPTGALTLTGHGLGEATVSMTETRSVMEAAADGAIMVSKVAGNQGTLSLSVQQVSDAHKFLLAMYNALVIAPPSQWAQGAGVLRSLADQTSHTFFGMCFQKIGDKPYRKQGEMVTWVLLCADIEAVPF